VFALYLNRRLWPFTALNSVLTQLWCNPEWCLTAPISRRRAHVVNQSLARTPSQGTTHHADDLAGTLALSCVLGASLGETLGEDSPFATSMPATPATDVQPEDHRNALARKVLQKTQCWLWRKRKRATGPASAPKLRQNRFKYSATPGAPDTGLLSVSEPFNPV